MNKITVLLSNPSPILSFNSAFVRELPTAYQMDVFWHEIPT